MKVLDYIVHETERQSGTMREALGMYQAYHYACGYVRDTQAIRASSLRHMHRLIMGSEVGGKYRQTPAVFNQGMPAVDAQNIERAMSALDTALTDPALRAVDRYDGYTITLNVPDLLTKEFLSIHPFFDGNGRVGSLLWNYLRGSLDDPEPMPYFFGEANA